MGKESSTATAPANALSSQSEQPFGEVSTQRRCPPGEVAAADAGREGLDGKVPYQPFDPLAPPLPECGTHSLSHFLAGVAPVGDPPAQHGHHGPGKAGSSLIDGRPRSNRPLRRAGENRPGHERVGQVALCGRGECRQVQVLGAEQGFSPHARRAPQDIEQPVLVVTEGPLDVP